MEELDRLDQLATHAAGMVHASGTAIISAAKVKQMCNDVTAIKHRMTLLETAMEHILTATSDPPKYGRYITAQDRQIIKDALAPNGQAHLPPVSGGGAQKEQSK